ncbi:hypothetical protein C2U33_24500, partial [Ralstonia solanacearum]
MVARSFFATGRPSRGSDAEKKTDPALDPSNQETRMTQSAARRASSRTTPARKTATRPRQPDPGAL